MIDIVKALRNRATWETATGITEPHQHIDWMAAEEITRLREENTRLKDALGPFVRRLKVIEEMKNHKYACATTIAVDHLRAARDAIQEGGKG